MNLLKPKIDDMNYKLNDTDKNVELKTFLHLNIDVYKKLNSKVWKTMKKLFYQLHSDT